VLERYTVPIAIGSRGRQFNSAWDYKKEFENLKKREFENEDN